ncbi:MAG: putative 2OG-Fe(II) oxygenase [Pseudomonadota bacterium]
MSALQYDVQPLFATPFFRASLADAITQDQIDFVKNLKMIKNRQNLISENLYIFEEPEMKSIKDAVQQALDAYAGEIMGISQRLYVTQSWGLANPPGVGMHSHAHSNSLVSGSLYFAPLPDPPSRVVFDKHVMYQRLELNPDPNKQNIYNTPVNVVTPEQGEVLLFPSEINHLVETNSASEDRWAIAFNCFVHGKLGNYRDVSELTL